MENIKTFQIITIIEMKKSWEFHSLDIKDVTKNIQ